MKTAKQTPHNSKATSFKSQLHGRGLQLGNQPITLSETCFFNLGSQKICKMHMSRLDRVNRLTHSRFHCKRLCGIKFTHSKPTVGVTHYLTVPSHFLHLSHDHCPCFYRYQLSLPRWRISIRSCWGRFSDPEDSELSIALASSWSVALAAAASRR